MPYNPLDPFGINEFLDGLERDSVEPSRPSMEQCSVCSMKFVLPKDLVGPQRLIPVHSELLVSKCGGSGKPPRD